MNNRSSSLVAVLMATYNGARYLEEQLLSILGQSHKNLDIFVRDDGSTDNSLELVQRYQSETRRIHMLPEGMRYGAPAPSFFALLDYAEKFGDYDFFAFCDQDDIWAPTKIAEALGSLKRDSADGYSANLIAFGFDPLTSYIVDKPSKLVSLDYVFQGASAGCTYVFSRRAARLILKQLGDINYMLLKTRSHDWLVYAICRSHGLKWIHDHRSFIFYRQHSQNSYGGNRGLPGILKRWALLRSGWYRDSVLFNSRFYGMNYDECEVLTRIARRKIRDRFWLARRAFRFRRSKGEAIFLAIYFIVII